MALLAIGARDAGNEKRIDPKINQRSGCVLYYVPPVVPFCPSLGEGSPSKIDYRKKGTLILTSLLEDKAWGHSMSHSLLGSKSVMFLFLFFYVLGANYNLKSCGVCQLGPYDPRIDWACPFSRIRTPKMAALLLVPL